MYPRRLVILSITLAAIAFSALPAQANILTSVTATADCSGYTLSVSATDLVPSNAPYTVNFTFNLSCQSSPVTGSITINASDIDASGNATVSASGSWPSAPLTMDCAVSGTAVLTSSGSTLPITINGQLQPTLSCGGTTPPPCFTVFGINGVNINDGLDEKTACVQGDVGTGSSSSGALMLNKCLVQGNIKIDSPAVLSLGSHGAFSGFELVADQTSVITSLNNLSSTDQGLTPNVTLTALTSNQTFTNSSTTGDTYVVYVTGNANLNGNTINFVAANPADKFVVNVAGNSNTISQSSINLSGITAAQVVFNFIGPSGCSVEVNKSNSNWNGIILAPRCSVRVHNPFPFVGEVYGYTVQIDSAASLKSSCP